MGSKWLCFGFLLFEVFNSFCNAQQYYRPSNSSAQGYYASQWYQQRPVATQAPIQTRATFRPIATQGPVTARPTYTQGPVTARPTYTQGPVTARPTYTQGPVTARPTYTQGPVTARPTYTQGPVTARPTYTQGPVTARPTYTQGPVTARPTYTQGPVTARPTYTQGPVTARPTYTQGPVTARPTYTQGPVTARPTYTQGPVTARPTYTQGPVTARPTYTQGPVTARPTYTQGPVTARPTYTQGPVTARPTYTQGPVTARPTTVVEPPLPKPDAVKVECGETSVQVQVDEDLFGIGNLIQASEITLGGCGPIGQEQSYLLFESELHDCGSTLMMTAETLVYTFTINYKPKAIGATPIIRTNGALVGVQCHYLRLHNVSSNALNPTWIPFYSTLSAEDILVFSLRLMADNWQMERASNVFFLGDLINIEASVIQANHVPLRVFMDRCVATLAPDMNSVPRYAFIDDKGCLMDSKLTSSRSKFQSRVTDDKLQVQLDAFRFSQDARSEIYIFCHLRATAASSDADGKACSFLPSNRWVSASGNDEVCSCCDTGCNVRKGRSLEHEAAEYSSIASLGPIAVQSNNMVSELPLPLKADDHSAAGISLIAVVMAGVVAVGLVLMMVFAVLRKM